MISFLSCGLVLVLPMRCFCTDSLVSWAALERDARRRRVLPRFKLRKIIEFDVFLIYECVPHAMQMDSFIGFCSTISLLPHDGSDLS